MKHVFIGDIHGQWEVVEEALAKDGIKIFVGDIMDSFTRSANDMARCLDLLLENECILLAGNHELGYCNMGMQCSGYKDANYYVFQDRFDKWSDKVQLFWTDPDLQVVATHAGISQRWLDEVAQEKRWMTPFVLKNRDLKELLIYLIEILFVP